MAWEWSCEAYDIIVMWIHICKNTSSILHLSNNDYMKASEPKGVNHVLHIIGVDSLRLGGLDIIVCFFVENPVKIM